MIVASDASVKDRKIGGNWIMIDNSLIIKLKNMLCHKEWSNNTIKSAKAIVLLELVKVIERKG